MTNWNGYYKRIRTAMELDRDDVVACCQLGGLEITRSRAEGWARGEHDRRRHVAMTEAEFDAFTVGLVEWTKQ